MLVASNANTGAASSDGTRAPTGSPSIARPRSAGSPSVVAATRVAPPTNWPSRTSSRTASGWPSPSSSRTVSLVVVCVPSEARTVYSTHRLPSRSTAGIEYPNRCGALAVSRCVTGASTFVVSVSATVRT